MLAMTPKEPAARKAITINPCKTCQPVGALYCALGVHGCMPHSHGSQGCVSYHRTILSRHFKEPAIASSSSFTEGASVFGGGSNLKTALRNVFDIYHPDIVAIHTTCLSETIGDDLNSYLMDATIPDGKYVVYANTPSYAGSHVTGFANMMAGVIRFLAEKGAPNGRTAIFPGFVNPGDIRELKRILCVCRVPFIMFPDQCDVMDAPMSGDYRMYPDGGTTIEEIKALGSCERVLALGALAGEEPANQLKRKCGVPYSLLGLPIGIEATDAFIMALAGLGDGTVPGEIEKERGRLIDFLLDAHPYFHAKSAAIYGDPDTVTGIAKLVLEMGMIPKYVLTGTPGEAFVSSVRSLLARYDAQGCEVKAAGDLFELHQRIKNDPVDIMIGTSYGKQIARAEDIPLVRAGFPVLDRYGHPYHPLVGYRGAMRLVEAIANALMDRRDRECNDEDFELVM
jgi:nitrogenase molybdenum-iron protein beta chain